MFTKLFTVLPLVALTAQALKVTSPDEKTEWGLTGSQTVSWESVSSDPSSFAIVFVNDKDNGAELTTLVSNQSTDAGSVSVSYPNGNWPEGKAFRINLVTSEDRREAILAQSPQFNISSSGASGSSSSSSSSTAASSSASKASSSMSTRPAASTATDATSKASVSPTGTGTYSGNANIPPASSKPEGGAAALSVNVFGAGLLSVLAAALVN